MVDADLGGRGEGFGCLGDEARGAFRFQGPVAQQVRQGGSGDPLLDDIRGGAGLVGVEHLGDAASETRLAARAARTTSLVRLKPSANVQAPTGRASVSSVAFHSEAPLVSLTNSSSR